MNKLSMHDLQIIEDALIARRFAYDDAIGETKNKKEKQALSNMFEMVGDILGKIRKVQHENKQV